MDNLNTAFNDKASDQKILKRKGLVVFLALLSAFVPLSTDLYLPALPTMTQYFNVEVYKTNLTLILFFVFYGAATLVWGPLSDKHGRRPILIIGLSIYAIASGLCAISVNIYQLMLFRAIQAIGGGCASAVATAIVKDVYQGKKRESTLALVQSMVVISPAVAPVIGALLLTFTSWRGVFIAQVILGLIVTAGSVALVETLENKNDGNLSQTIGRLWVVLKNPSFATLVINFSMVSIITMAFISSSSYIYQQTFKQSSQVYSYFFTFNAIGMLIGPYIYVKLSQRFKRFNIIKVCFGIMVASGVLIFIFGAISPYVFAIVLLPATVASSCIRPGGTYLMLEQQKGDTGSASSLMSSFVTVMGSIGMIIVSFTNGNYVEFVGALNIIFGLICLMLWLISTRGPNLNKIRKM